MKGSIVNAVSIGGILWSVAFAVYITLGLPERVPVHFGIDGQPDRFGNRLEASFGLLILPVLAIVLNASMILFERGDARGRAQSGVLGTARVGVTLLLAVVQFAIAQSYQSQRFDSRLVMIGLGVMLVVLGNVLPKVEPNPYAGVRIPYTFASDRAWRKANRASGWLLVGLGVILAALGALLSPEAALYGMFVLPVGVVLGVLWLVLIAKREYEADPERRPLR
jgi:uncharacterized membrane protein